MKKFNDMDKFNRQFNIVWKIALGFIAVVFVLILASYIGVGCLCAKGYSYVTSPDVQQHGLSGVVEKVLYGKDGQRK